MFVLVYLGKGNLLDRKNYDIWKEYAGLTFCMIYRYALTLQQFG
jgi:hypothetical protein